MSRILLMLILLATVVLFPATSPPQEANAQNQPVLALYSNGVPTTTFAPGSQIEVRGSHFRDNQSYFVGIISYAGWAAVDPDPDNTFTVYFTAPNDPWPNYQMRASHFQGGGKLITDYTVVFSVA